MSVGRAYRSSFFALSIAASACGGATRDVDTDSSHYAASPAAGQQEERAIDADTSVTLQRTECFGACPAYSLRIAGDGSVAYRGERFVKVVGEASSEVPVSEVERLVDAMLDANYFALRVPGDCYASSSDAPTVTTSLTWGGRSKTLEHYHGNPCAPSVLSELEDTIDAIAGSEQWLRCDTPGGYCSGSR